MNISLAKQQIKDTVEAYLQKDDAGMYVIAPVHQRPIFLLGAPGIGKTAIMEQIAGELNIGIVSYSMTHHTRQSALGLPRIEQRCFEGVEYQASEYTMSEIVAAVYEYIERTGLRNGILFLDEINCVSETLYPSMLQFLQFKTFGKHRVPEGWVIVCAGNPPEYNRSVHEFDIVTLDRLREIDVEPEYGAWKDYAAEKGLHPVVTTFLEAKKDCFYKVESKPGGGKAFVTARGWEDLAQIISLYESMGKTVDRDLFAQFLRDDDIADQFSVYYSLFEKYRSDYQVGTILAGEATDAIRTRAKAAEFDERIALLGLLIDALSQDCAQTLDQEDIAVELRDILREAKSELLAGATVDDAIGKRIQAKEHSLERKIASGIAAKAYVRRERLVIDTLRGFNAQCILDHTTAGEAAFGTIQTAYKAEVAKIQPLADEAGRRMSNAFDFIDECFGSRELLVFMAELTTRRTTTQFIAHYGNEKYYAHNEELQVDASRMGLTDRVKELQDINEKVSLSEGVGFDMGGAVGLKGGGTIPASQAYGAGSIRMSTKNAESRSDQDHSDSDQNEAENPFKEASETASNARAYGKEAIAPSLEALKEHYHGKQFEYGFSSICKMILPAEQLKGKKILNIGCRRGRGVYKMSAMAGNNGRVLGLDWGEAYVAEAKDGMDRAWHDSGLKGNNMDFRVAYPEDLIGAGVGSSTQDVVYVNNVMTLFYDQGQAIAEMGRVLKPGGLLIMETVFADRDRTPACVGQARELGNSIQAAQTREQNLAWLEAAGFGEPEFVEELAVEADRGYQANHKVAVAPGDEEVQYRAVTLFVRKK